MALYGASILPDPEHGSGFQIMSVSGEVFKLKAQNSKERHRWISSLRACTGGPLRPASPNDVGASAGASTTALEQKQPPMQNCHHPMLPIIKINSSTFHNSTLNSFEFNETCSSSQTDFLKNSSIQNQVQDLQACEQKIHDSSRLLSRGVSLLEEKINFASLLISQNSSHYQPGPSSCNAEARELSGLAASVSPDSHSGSPSRWEISNSQDPERQLNIELFKLKTYLEALNSKLQGNLSLNGQLVEIFKQVTQSPSCREPSIAMAKSERVGFDQFGFVPGLVPGPGDATLSANTCTTILQSRSLNSQPIITGPTNASLDRHKSNSLTTDFPNLSNQDPQSLIFINPKLNQNSLCSLKVKNKTIGTGTLPGTAVGHSVGSSALTGAGVKNSTSTIVYSSKSSSSCQQRENQSSNYSTNYTNPPIGSSFVYKSKHANVTSSTEKEIFKMKQVVSDSIGSSLKAIGLTRTTGKLDIGDQICKPSVRQQN